MKVRCPAPTKETEFDLTAGKIYEVLSIEKDWYRIVDDSEEDCQYPADIFEIVEGSSDDVPRKD